MNVLLVGKDWNTPRAGGLDRYFVDMTHYLKRAGARPVALVNEVGAAAGPHVHSFGGSGKSLISRWTAVRRSVSSLFCEHRFDLVNLHFALYAFPLMGRLRPDLPVICHFHGPWAAESHVEQLEQTSWQYLRARMEFQAKRFMEQNVYSRCDRFIVLSSAFQQVLHQQYRISLDRIEVIPGGVDIDRFRPAVPKTEARLRLGWPEDRPLIVAVRRLARRMGLENLIDAMEAVRRRCPDVLLIIGGRGHLENELRQRIRERDLERHVRLAGFIPDEDLPLAYRAADFSVVPTVALEGFGLVITESLACGTPALGTPIGGIPEILRPFDERLVFESHEPGALADRIAAVLTQRLALPDEAACRHYAVSHFAWEQITRQVMAVFAAARGSAADAARVVS